MSATEIDELEDHLCSTYQAHLERGMAPGDAFATALRAFGCVEQVSSEYRKVRGTTWLRLLKSSWAVFAVAFLLPVADGGITLLDPDLGGGLLPGFQAIRVALEEGGWSTFSALTNLLMLATMWRVSGLGRRPIFALGMVALASALLNGWWLTEMDPISDLRAGYYMWWASFGLASTGLLMRARELWGNSIRALLA